MANTDSQMMRLRPSRKPRRTQAHRKNTVAWNEINWRKVELSVFKLQKRIYQASRNDNVKKLRRLQKTLVNSHNAKLLSVRKISQDNQGKKTAGVDGIKSLSPKERLALASNLKLEGKSKPVRRVWIPKSNNKKRPLGIPTIKDRALQTLVAMALEPEWEARFEPNSYGFRPGRSCHDAIQSIFNQIRYQSKFVLDADISKCFDKINHSFLLRKINTFPKFRNQIKAWLKGGVIDSGKTIFPEEGSPQGGAISPLLANIALHGMELRIKEYASTGQGVKQDNKKSLSLIRYADDFLIIHKNLTVIKNCKVIISEWLKEVGLELNLEKTKIKHTLNEHNGEKPGFDFLGFNIRQYKVGKYQSGKTTNGIPLGFKTIIKPSKEKVKDHYRDLANIVNRHKASPQHVLISKLNPVIRGWCNYYRAVCSNDTFQRVYSLLFVKLLKWGFWRHKKKRKSWVIDKYWLSVGSDNWRFGCEIKGLLKTLIKHSDIKIVRFTKVKGDSSPYDGNSIYWASRMGRHPEVKPSIAKLLKKQRGKCNFCELSFKPGDKIERDHIKAIKAGGSNKLDNLQAIHKHCHDVKTKTDLVEIENYKITKRWNSIYSNFQKRFANAEWLWEGDIPTLV